MAGEDDVSAFDEMLSKNVHAFDDLLRMNAPHRAGPTDRDLRLHQSNEALLRSSSRVVEDIAGVSGDRMSAKSGGMSFSFKPSSNLTGKM